ncbi:MAG TPA: hypothetical protein VIR54_20440, partial [Vicinamibacterales bacterium]
AARPRDRAARPRSRSDQSGCTRLTFALELLITFHCVDDEAGDDAVRSLTLNTPAIGGDFFSGSLNASGELAGTFSQGPVTVPLTFQRARK